MSGLPGSGKSSIADGVGRRLGAAVLAVDRIQAAMLRSGLELSWETGVAAYEVAGALAVAQDRLGLDVVIDAVNAVEIARDTFRSGGVPWCAIEVVCSDVDEHRRRLTARVRDIDGWPEPTWELVEQRRAEWEPWPGERLLLDSVDDLATNIERAAVWVDAQRPAP